MHKYILFLVVGILSTSAQAVDWFTGKDVNIGKILYPHFRANVVVGDASENPEGLTVGHHDPGRQFTVQGVEAGMSLRLKEHLEGFATINFSYGVEKKWENEWEEFFLKLVNLPGKFELRGGRLLNRFGIINSKHLHSWNFVNMPLVNGRFLGGDGLVSEGADATWYMPTPFTSALTVGYGEARGHAHAHDEEGHAHNEAAEEARFEDNGDVFTANYIARYQYDDFNRYDFGVSFAVGDNGLNDDTFIYGVNFGYQWRENGMEAGGKFFTWNNELFLRDMNQGTAHVHEEKEHEHVEDGEHGEEHGHEDEHASLDGKTEFGFYSEVIYGMSDYADAGLRIEFVEGIDAIELEERIRLSPALTFYLNEARNIHLRLQYNYDDREHHKDAHSGWVQLQYSFGGKEVR